MRALFDGGVAVYPVEVRGSASAASNTLTQIAMKELALLTGGKAFFGSNDPFPEILATSNGNTAGYVLGYSEDTTSSSDFRRIEVTANRANTEVAHPAGYFPYEGTTKSRAGAEIGLAMSSPLEYTGIRFKISVVGMEEGTGGKKKVNLVISLPGDSGVLNEAAGTVASAIRRYRPQTGLTHHPVHVLDHCAAGAVLIAAGVERRFAASLAVVHCPAAWHRFDPDALSGTEAAVGHVEPVRNLCTAKPRSHFRHCHLAPPRSHRFRAA